MKPGIHPPYNLVHVKCSCGNEFDVRSSYSAKEMHIEVCAACHPFYTGKQKILDSTGQVDKFHKRFGAHHLKALAGKSADTVKAAAEPAAAEK